MASITDKGTVIGDVPHPDRAVLRGGQEELAAGTETAAIDGATVAMKHPVVASFAPRVQSDWVAHGGTALCHRTGRVISTAGKLGPNVHGGIREAAADELRGGGQRSTQYTVGRAEWGVGQQSEGGDNRVGGGTTE